MPRRGLARRSAFLPAAVPPVSQAGAGGCFRVAAVRPGRAILGSVEIQSNNSQ